MSDARRHERLASWFEESSRLEGAERETFLDRCRSEDVELFLELCELLDHDTRGDAGLDAGLGSDAVAELAAGVLAASDGMEDDGTRLDVGATVGPYTIGRRLGSGGFADVHEARQTEPVTRDVALKVLRSGADSKHVVARFSAELQAQARMSHEHVARVFDAGTTDGGRPYLAMELVEGQPITRWCDERGLGLRARLELFGQACAAIQHAHQKGVVHRDIKPSNVLVGEGGAHGSVKIIDFGIAKAIEGSLTDDTLRTLEGQLLGTPEFMSPEQAGGRPEDVDTRTDVYAIGVLLYELLSGARPFDFADVTLVEVQRTILEVDPPRPSRRLVPGLADPAWERALRSDLDWVVMRALEKEPARRYGAVEGLSADVERFLRDEPLDASPPSRAYRARKFVRRNRTTVAATVLVIGSLVGGLAWALVERERANMAASNESLAKSEAEARASEVEEVAAFQESQFMDLDTEEVGRRIRVELRNEIEAALARRAGDSLGADAEVAEGLAQLDDLLTGTNFTNVAVDTLDDAFLQATIDSVDERFSDEPRIRARLLGATAAAQQTMGLVPRSLPTHARAVEEAERGYGIDHFEAYDARLSLASALRVAGETQRAVAAYDALIAETEGRDDLVPLRIHALRERAMLADAANDVPVHDRRFAEYQELVADTYEEGHRETILARAEAADAATDPEEAEAHYLAAIEGWRRLDGPDDPSVLRLEDNYAGLLVKMGRRREALEIRMRVLDGLRSALGDRHRSTLRTMESIGVMLHDDRDFVAAEALIREAYDARVETYGRDNIESLGTGGNLAMVLATMERPEEAVEIYEEVLPGQRAALGVEHQDTLGTMTNLSIAYNKLGRHQEALEILGTCLPIKRRVLGDDHLFTQAAIAQAIIAHQALAQHDEARPLAAELLDIKIRRARRERATAEEVGRAAEDILLVEYPELRDADLALEFAERAVELEQQDAGAMLYWQLARVALAYWHLGDLDQGLEYVDRAAAVAPPHSQERMEIIRRDFEERLAREERDG
ncbi:MAG: serine/threonine-protein kinase [Planctomycetota bacterium]